MIFRTPTEEEIIAKARKNLTIQRRWRFVWPVLFLAFMLMIPWFLNLAQHHIAILPETERETWVGWAYGFVSGALVFMIAGSAGMSLGYWIQWRKGNPQDRLLVEYHDRIKKTEEETAK
jgi:hypothetical protein